MRTIQVLDPQTIDKIAAGEVVENPASVVKELIENSIDAGATAVTAEIRDGGLSMIRVTDNGAGIPPEQVRLAFTRHATSKIRQAEDLTEIVSLGFRGEALSSISAVSRTECMTRTPEALTGIRYCIEGGTEKDLEEIGAPSGTTIVVRNLFYNTPARAKFLKSPQAEGSRVSTVVEELALSHPDISFKFIMNGQTRLFTGGSGDLKEIIYQVFGKDLARELLPVDVRTDLLTLTGFIGKPDASRGNRSFENYFVNGRYVKNQVITKAIEDGYQGFLMQHRYPFTLLYLEIDTRQVDVNVHPAKMEVRLSGQQDIYHAVCLAVQNTLMRGDRVPEVSAGPSEAAPPARPKLPVLDKGLPEPFEARRRGNAGPVSEIRSAEKVRENPVQTSEAPADTSALTAEASKYAAVRPGESGKGASLLLREESSAYGRRENVFAERPVQTGEQLSVFREPGQKTQQIRVIGQLFGTYWLAEFDDALYVIDQHAAHEKVLYERLMAQYREKKVLPQMLYPAVILHPSAKEAGLIREHADTFAALGFELEPFGGTAWKISAVPSNLYSISGKTLFTDILAELESVSALPPSSIPERLASMACKAAVKGSHLMSAEEIRALILEMMTLENPYNCPHGRPTVIRMTHRELDKKFRRIV